MRGVRGVALRLALRPLLSPPLPPSPSPEGKGEIARLAGSVIIATCERCTYLELTLASLERQTVPHDLWEVVVADDASRDGTRNLTPRPPSRLGKGELDLRIVRLPERSGREAALQAACDAACGTVLVFLGDDCLATPDWLERHLLAHVRRDDVVVLGDTHLRVVTHLYSQPDATVDSPYAQPIIKPVDLDNAELMSRRVYPGGSDYRELADAPNLWMALDERNFSVRRERLEAAGGWLAWGGVAVRLRHRGGRFRYEGSAVAMAEVRAAPLRGPLTSIWAAVGRRGVEQALGRRRRVC